MRITDRRAIAQAHLQTPRLFLMAIGALISNDEFPSHRALKVGETASSHKKAPTAADNMIPGRVEAAQRFAPLVRTCRDEGERERRLPAQGPGGDARGAAGRSS